MAFGSQQYPRQQYTTWPASDRPLLAWKPVQWATSATPDSRYASVAPSKPVSEMVKEYASFVKPVQTTDKPWSIESISNPAQSQASSAPSTNAFSAFTGQFWGAENVGSIQWLDKSTVPTNTGIADTSWDANPETVSQVTQAYTSKQNEAVGSLLDDIKFNGIAEEEIQQLYPEFANLSPDVLGSLYDDIKFNGIQENEVQWLYPELYTGIKSDEQIADMNNPLNAINPFIWEWQAAGKFRNLDSDEVIPYMTATDNAQTTPEVFAEFGKNALKSAWNLWAGIGNMALNPVDSIKTIGKLWLWALANTYEAITGDEMNGENAQLASAVGQYFATRYGSMEWFQEASYKDPVGVFSDLASIVSGGATVASKTAALTSRIAKLWGATNVATKAGNVANIAKNVAKVADAIDPATYAMRWAMMPYQIGGKALKQWAGMIADSKAGQYVAGKARNAIDFSWLWSVTRKTLQENPYAAAVARDFIDSMQRNWEVDPEAAKLVEQQSISRLSEEVQTALDQKVEQVSESAMPYGKAKEYKWDIATKPLIDKINSNDFLKEYNAKINNDWTLNLDDSNVPIAERSHVQTVWKDLHTLPYITDATSLMNRRTNVGKSINWQDGVMRKSSQMVKGMYDAITNFTKESIPWVKEIDAEFSPQRQMLDAFKKEIVNSKWEVLKGMWARIKGATDPKYAKFMEALDMIDPSGELRLKIEGYSAGVKAGKEYFKSGAFNSKIWTVAVAYIGSELLSGLWIKWQVAGAALWLLTEYLAGKAAIKLKQGAIERVLKQITPDHIQAMNDIVNKAKIGAAKLEASKQKMQEIYDLIAKENGAVEQKKLDYDQFIADLEPKIQALPEKAEGYNLGTDKNPIVWQGNFTNKGGNLPSNNSSNVWEIASDSNSIASNSNRSTMENADNKSEYIKQPWINKWKSVVSQERQWDVSRSDSWSPMRDARQPAPGEWISGRDKGLGTVKPKTILDTIVAKKIAERKAKVETSAKIDAPDSIDPKTGKMYNKDWSEYIPWPNSTVKGVKQETPTKPQGEKPKNDVLSRAIDKVKNKKKVEPLAKSEKGTIIDSMKTKELTLYHGTKDWNTFDRFDSTKWGKWVWSNVWNQWNQIYLTESEAAAKYFGKLATERAKLLEWVMPWNEKGNVLQFKLSKDAKILDLDNIPNWKDWQAIIEKAKKDWYDAVRFPDKAFDNMAEWQSKEWIDSIYKDWNPPKTIIVINDKKLQKIK